MKAEKAHPSLPECCTALPALFVAMLLSLPATQALALQALDDDDMSDVSGAGIALLPENFQIAFNDLAYIQAIPTGLPTTGNVADLYWYGLQLTGANNVTSRAGNTSPAINPWGTADNPWLLKVESPSALKYSTSTAATTAVPYPVLNYYAPRALATDQSATAKDGSTPTTPAQIAAAKLDGVYQSVNNGGLKYAFWGDVVVRTAAAGCAANPTSCTEISRMRSQSIWNDFTLNGSRFSIFQNTYDNSFGLSWINRINSKNTSVMRFSVNQSSGTTSELSQGLPVPATAAPGFTNSEGLYITDMDINMIVGVQHYQPVILDNASNTNDPATTWDETKNFSIELVRIPNSPSIYGNFYRDYSGSASDLAKLCTNSTLDCTGATHSQIGMGNVKFVDPSNVTTANLGSTLIEGLMIQHLKITTTGI